MYIRLFRLSLRQFTHRSISFDQLTVEFLLLSFHGGIFSSIVAEKEDKSKVECKERRYSRAVGSAVGGVCRYGLLYQGTRHSFIEYSHVNIQDFLRCISTYVYTRLFRSSLLKFWFSIDLSHSMCWRSAFFFHHSTVGSLFPSLQRKTTSEKMGANNGDIYRIELQAGGFVWQVNQRHRDLFCDSRAYAAMGCVCFCTPRRD